ncbi:MAG: hypothetical protein ACSLFA_14210 [Mycobacterium sp.]
MNIFIGTEALHNGSVSEAQLRTGYIRVFRNVYRSRDSEASLHTNTVGAWLWSNRRSVITGRAAAALHGSRWVNDAAPVELIYYNNHQPRGILTRKETLTHHEVIELHGMAVASLARTGFDLGRHLPLADAVSHLDALANATGLRGSQILPFADLYKGARGVRQLRKAIDLMDGGAQSPQESRLRLLLVEAEFPRPQTQIPVWDGGDPPFAYLDMGWEHLKIAVEYDGRHHQTDRGQYVKDIGRLRRLEQLDWIIVRVVAEDRPGQIIDRVSDAWTRRGAEKEATVVNPAA